MSSEKVYDEISNLLMKFNIISIEQFVEYIDNLYISEYKAILSKKEFGYIANKVLDDLSQLDERVGYQIIFFNNLSNGLLKKFIIEHRSLFPNPENLIINYLKLGFMDSLKSMPYYSNNDAFNESIEQYERKLKNDINSGRVFNLEWFLEQSKEFNIKSIF